MRNEVRAFMVCVRSLGPVLAALLLIDAAVAELPRPNPLPAGVSADLQGKRAALESQGEKLDTLIAKHDQNCSHVLHGSPEAARCALEAKRLEEKAKAYLDAVKEFNGLANQPSRGTATTASTIAKLEKQIVSDEEAIRRLGFQKRAADFEEWSKLTEEARNQFISETLRILGRLALDEAAINLKNPASSLSSSLTPKEAEGLITRRGLEDTPLAAAIMRLAKATTIKERTDAANSLILATNLAVQTYSVESSSDKQKATVEAFCETAGDIGFKKFGLVSWQTRALVSTAELTAELGFAYGEQHIAESTIRDLDQMTEAQLKAVQKLSEVLRKHVNELKAAKQPL